jgi:hypothetical protein
MRKRTAVLAAALFGSFAATSPTRSAYIVTFSQVGPDVVASGRGAIDLNGLIFVNSGVSVPQVGPTFATEATGAAGPLSAYSAISGPSSFGPGVFTNATTGTGDLVALEAPEGVGGLVYVPTGYVSGAPLSDTATYAGQTFATLGLTPGRYVYTWSSDSFTVQIGPTAASEPASMALLGAGLLGLIATRRSRKPM